MSPVSERPSIGILVVHGVGKQERGETLAKLGSGLRRMFPELPDKLVDGEPVTLSDRSARFYEVYWADLLMGERVSNTFDGKELLSLAWFPFFNQIYDAYAQEPYPLWTVLRFTIVLPLVGFALSATFYGAQMFAKLWWALRQVGVKTPEPPELSGKSFIERAKYRADIAAHEPTVIDKLLDEYVGDVFNYVNSAGDTFAGEREVSKHLTHVYRDVIDRFYDQLARARNDGCQHIQIVSHSLGTVVMYHALRGLRLDESTRPDGKAITEAMGRIEHIYTIGSPLEKIRFFWPRLRPERNLVGERELPWDNFVSYFDPVAGVLRRYGEWGRVKNHHLLGGGFLSGHIVYERSSVFLETFVQGLLGKSAALHRTTGEKLKDVVMLLGETLFAPAALLILLVVGTASWIGLMMLVPFLVSLPFRPFFGPEIWRPIVYYGSLYFGASLLFAVFSVSAGNARKTLGRLRSTAQVGQMRSHG